jgi:hypothetical protein
VPIGRAAALAPKARVNHADEPSVPALTTSVPSEGDLHAGGSRRVRRYRSQLLKNPSQASKHNLDFEAPLEIWMQLAEHRFCTQRSTSSQKRSGWLDGAESAG